MALIVAGTFGPYVSQTMGIRTEQVILYASAFLLVPMTVLKARMTRLGLRVVSVWLALVVLAVGGSLLATTTPGPNSPLSGLDNLLLPIATMIVVHGLRTIAGRASTASLIRTAEYWIVICLSANALIALYGVFADISPFGRFFWTSGGDPTSSVAATAASNGRETGLFNQPLESGLAYSVGLFAFMHLRKANRLKGLKGRMFLLLLMTGGLLSVSKVFLLLGLPLALLAPFIGGVRQFSMRGVLLVGSVLVGLAVLAVYVPWEGRSRLEGTISVPSDQGILTFYSAGRLGYGGSSQRVVETVLQHAPAFGFGLTGLAVAYDNAWVEMIVTAGLVGAGSYTIVLTTIALGAFRRRKLMRAKDRALSRSLAVLVILAGIGGPTLTANRAGVLVWILLTLLLFSTADESMIASNGTDQRMGTAELISPSSLTKLQPGSASTLSTAREYSTASWQKGHGLP